MKNYSRYYVLMTITVLFAVVQIAGLVGLSTPRKIGIVTTLFIYEWVKYFGTEIQIWCEKRKERRNLETR